MNVSKTKSKKLIKKKENKIKKKKKSEEEKRKEKPKMKKKKKKVRRKKEKKNLKWICSCFFFLDRKHKEENSTELQKANREVEICRGNKPYDL